MKKMDIFYQINFNILNDYKNNDNIQKKNYQKLQNLIDISNNIKMSSVDKIINEKNISNKIAELLEVYDKMVHEEENHDVIPKKIDKKIIEYNISENLQTLIFIVLQQQNLIKNDILKENHKYQNVFLINKRW